jgi:hypothetical protein
MLSSGFHARYLVRNLALWGDITCDEIRVPSAIQVQRVVLLDSRADGVRKADIGRSQEPRTAAIAQ